MTLISLLWSVHCVLPSYSHLHSLMYVYVTYPASYTVWIIFIGTFCPTCHSLTTASPCNGLSLMFSDTKNGLCVCVHECGACQSQRWCLCDLCGIIFSFPLHPEFLQKASQWCVSVTYFSRNKCCTTHIRNTTHIFFKAVSKWNIFLTIDLRIVSQEFHQHMEDAACVVTSQCLCVYVFMEMFMEIL